VRRTFRGRGAHRVESMATSPNCRPTRVSPLALPRRSRVAGATRWTAHAAHAWAVIGLASGDEPFRRNGRVARAARGAFARPARWARGASLAELAPRLRRRATLLVRQPAHSLAAGAGADLAVRGSAPISTKTPAGLPWSANARDTTMVHDRSPQRWSCVGGGRHLRWACDDTESWIPTHPTSARSLRQ
jgi:hypothetical protein